MGKLKHKVGIVLFYRGKLGGATKRFTNIYSQLSERFPSKVYFIVNQSFYRELILLYPRLNYKTVFVINTEKENLINKSIDQSSKNQSYTKNSISINTSILDNAKGIIKHFTRIFGIWNIYLFFKVKKSKYKIFRQIDGIVMRNQIDVLLGVFSGILPLYYYFDKKNRPAIIFCNMDSWFSEVVEKNIYRWYMKYKTFNYGLENSDLVDFLSPYIQKGIQQRGIELKDGRIRITPSSFVEYEQCNVGKKSTSEFAFAARLAKDKNPLIYLKAIKRIILKYPQCKFHLLGSGTLEDDIKNYINNNGLIYNVNFQYHPNPPEILSRTLAFVSIQTTNNYPSQSVLEAMACGNAIIASDVGDTRMFVNEKTGILINLNVDDLTDALENFIVNPAEAIEKGKNAREFVLKEHTIERSLNYYIDLFNEAVNST